MQNLSSDLLSDRISESRQNSGDEYEFLQYATRIRHRHQRIVHRALAERGFPSFLRLYKVRRRWSDLIVQIEERMFVEGSEAAALKRNRGFKLAGTDRTCRLRAL